MVRGQVPVGFVVLKDGITAEPDFVNSTRNWCSSLLPSGRHCRSLPKTRSGKILRKTIRRLAVETDVPVPPTIDDPKIMTELLDAMQSKGSASK